MPNIPIAAKCPGKSDDAKEEAAGGAARFLQGGPLLRATSKNDWRQNDRRKNLRPPSNTNYFFVHRFLIK
jgi:hypothetical protein